MQSAVSDLCRLLGVIARTFVWKAPEKKQAPPPPPVTLGPRSDAELFEEGPVVVDGEVVSMPLRGKVGRNIPEGNLFEPGKSQKGAHEIRTGR
jgi:hypothetical protein